MMIAQHLLPLLVVCPVLLACAWTDVRLMRIPNALVIAALAVFVVMIPAIGLETALWRLLAGAVTFAFCFGLFAARLIGGGDAKLFPVMILFVPVSLHAEFMIVFSFSMAICMALVMATKRVVQATEGSGWKSMDPGRKFPMGTAFAMSAVAFLLLAHLFG
jgi:prepilin peptidase CpaA